MFISNSEKILRDSKATASVAPKVMQVQIALKSLEKVLPFAIVTFKDGSVGFRFINTIGKKQAETLVAEIEELLPEADLTVEPTSKTRVAVVGVV